MLLQCSTCARCKNGYCLFYVRPVNSTSNYCAHHTDKDKNTPVTETYQSPTQKELDKEMKLNNKIDGEYPFTLYERVYE